jgi:hypothetical protein
MKERSLITVPAETLTDLRQRLVNTRWPEEVGNENWEYGTKLLDLKALVTEWQTTYDWRSHERATRNTRRVAFAAQRGASVGESAARWSEKISTPSGAIVPLASSGRIFPPDQSRLLLATTAPGQLREQVSTRLPRGVIALGNVSDLLFLVREYVI